MNKVSSYINEDLISFFEAKDRDEAIAHLVDLVDAKGILQDRLQFLTAIFEREKIVSTGIGLGVAIPHAKLTNMDDFFIAIGCLKNGVDWNAMDKAPVRLIFLIGGPDDKQTEYLQILSALTVAIKDDGRRKKILNAREQNEIMEVFKSL
jgi:PTS system nitrogen regulatory IIA component